MPFAKFIATLVFIVAHTIAAVENAREVEGGVQLLSTGPIQLVIPDVLSFTIKNNTKCRGAFEICYVAEPTKSREELRWIYFNVGYQCPPDSCTLLMEMTGSDMGLALEIHDGNFYGMLVKNSKFMCPRYAVDERTNFTVTELPSCPVIVNDAMLLKNEAEQPKNHTSDKWVIAICVGLGLRMSIISLQPQLTVYFASGLSLLLECQNEDSS
uniref:DUF3707 domain-containing protein n=1 Tax=Panagrellus redivivus TaxID=6233 RepID=A0A7E4WAL4_PANRE